jgi:hypothetical protein
MEGIKLTSFQTRFLDLGDAVMLLAYSELLKNPIGLFIGLPPFNLLFLLSNMKVNFNTFWPQHQIMSLDLITSNLTESWSNLNGFAIGCN